MKALFAIVVLLIGLLVFTYYWNNNRKYFRNRPTFFNSKPRRISLIVFFFLCTGYSAYLFESADWGYGWVLIIMLFYVVGYFIVEEGISQNEMINKVFMSHHAITLPEVGMKAKEVLPNTASFTLDWMGYPKQTVNKAEAFIKDEIKEGKIKDVFDLPSAIATYIAALMNSGDPKGFEKVVFSRLRLQKIYDRVYTGKDDRSTFRKKFDFVVGFIDRYFTNFSFLYFRPPDFSEAEIELREHALYDRKAKGETEYKILPMFTQISANVAMKFGWIKSLDEYMILANLEFARRNPTHYLSKEIKKKYKFSDQEIQDLAQGKDIPEGLKFDL